MPAFTHVYGLCPNCSDGRGIPATMTPDHDVTCGWCGYRGTAIEWVQKGRAERARMGFPPVYHEGEHA